MEIQEYIYINKDGIDSLLAQLTDELVLDTTIEETSNRSGKAKGSFSFSGLFKAVASADAGIEGELGVQYSKRRSISLAYEQKLAVIYNKLCNSKLLCLSLNAAMNQQSKNCPFKADLMFSTNQRFDSSESMSQLVKDGYLLFEYQSYEYKPQVASSNPQYPKRDSGYDSYNYSDDYYKESQINAKRIFMNLSIDKLTTGLGMTSHLPTIIRGSGGYNLTFGVFGYLIKVSPNYMQIKPYAVWM